MFLLLVFWEFWNQICIFLLSVLSVPVNQTHRDSTVLNVVVCLSLVVDIGQWHVCVRTCFFLNNTLGSQTFKLRRLHIDRSLVLHALLTVFHFVRNCDSLFVIYTVRARSLLLTLIKFSFSCHFNGTMCY
jgi:hypothetical protein